jgi:hypothetical protein
MEGRFLLDVVVGEGSSAPRSSGGIGCCGRFARESSGSTGLGAARYSGFYRTQFSLRKPVWSSVPNSWR